MEMACYGNVPAAVDASFSADVVGKAVVKQLETVATPQLDVFVAWASRGQCENEVVHFATNL
jgi:hypothetical protein